MGISTSRYVYDALGRRLKKRSASESGQASSYYGWDGDRLIHTEHTDALKPEQRQITHTVYEPGSFTPLVQLSTKAKAQAKPQVLALMAGDEDDDSPMARMLDALPSDMHQALEQSLRQAMQEGIPAPMQVLMGEDQSQNTLQRLTGLREQLEKQEQTQQTPITVRHYHCDHLGTPLALTDQNQQIVWAARLDPWGNVEQEFNPHDIDQSIRLPGQHHDKDTGLYYNRHRYYDPSIGAYINQDPIGLQGGSNKYPYARDPNVFIDPAGLEAQIVGHLAGGPVGRLTSPNSYHLAIQLNPGKDCDLGGVKTLGGQPSGNFANGNLVSKPNYPGDSKDIAYTQAIPTPEGMSDCEFLKRLIKASGTYCNCLKYSKPDVSMMPGVSDGNMPAGNYNSNSFVSGVIESAGGKPPVLQTGGAWQAPGYQNPVPISNNIAPVGSVYTAPAK